MRCNICGGDNVNLVNNSIVYGKEYGRFPYVFLCNDCKAYVGVHPDMSPMGILADNEMRVLRRKCHAIFDKTWATKKERVARYNALAEKLGCKQGECHFSWMSKQELEMALSVLEASE